MNPLQLKILEYLSYNCRLSTSQIAKLLKTQRYRVDYYKKKFVKDKIIIGHELLLNYDFLGYTEYFIYLRVFKYQKVKPKIIEFLAKDKKVRWAGEAITKYNLRIVAVARNTDEIEYFIHELNKTCENHIIETEILSKRDLIKKESYSTIEYPKIDKKPVLLELKKQDKELLKALAQNPEESLVVLAKKSELSIENVRQKLKKFEEIGFILGYTAKYNMEKLGISSWANILLKINNVEKYLKKFRTILYSNLSYGRTWKLFSKWNFEITIFTSSYNQLFSVMNSLEEIFGDDLEAFDIHITTGKLISTRVPQVVFEN